MTVLFVCVHNAGRSQMAEAYFNYFAAERGLDARAESAGTRVGAQINAEAMQAMEEDGISLKGQQPKLLTQPMVRQADKVITMGCGVDAEACPARYLPAEDWGLDDPAEQPIERVREIRDVIKAKVIELLEGLPENR